MRAFSASWLIGLTWALSACAHVSHVEELESGSSREIRSTESNQVIGSESEFDFMIGLDAVMNNNSARAGETLALREASKLCGLDRTPTAKDVRLTQGLSHYFYRSYFIHCPEPGKDS